MAGSDTEIIVQLTAETAQLQAGMDAGAASVTKATEEMRANIAKEAAAFNAAVQAKIEAIVRLNAAFSGNVTSTAAITEAEAALDQAMAAGAITAAEYAGFVGRLDAAEVALTGSTVAATAALDINTASLGMNARMTYSLSALLSDVASGQFGRSKREIAALGNESGLLGNALGFLLTPLGLAAEAAAALGVAAYQAAQDEDALREAILNTGNVSGYNVDQLQTMERALRDVGATAGQAKEAVLATASAGNLLGANFQNAAQGAVDMAQLTGISVQQAVAEFSKLQHDPVKAIQKLNETMNFLSPTEAAEIKHLSDIGDKAGAASRAIADLASAEASRVKQQRDAGGGAESFTGKLSNDAQSVWAGVKSIFSKGDLQQQLDEVNKTLTQYSQDFNGAITQDSNNKLHVDQSKIGWGERPIINKLLQDRADLMAKITAEGEAQEAQSAKAQADQAQVNATLSAKAPKDAGGGHADHAQAQSDRDAFNQQRLQHSMSLADEKTYWQAKLAAAKQGTDAYRQAVNELLQIKNKEASESKAEARQEIADAKHVAAEKVNAAKEAERAASNALAMQRLGTQANTAARLQADAAILASTTAYSNEQRAALSQLLADEKSYDASIVKARTQALAQIAAEEKKNTQLIKKAYDQAYADAAKSWHKYLDPITNAFNQSINGMIQGTQTFRQLTQNMLQSLVASYAQEGLKELEAYIIKEQAKTAATAAGATERATIEAAAAAKSKATDAATGKSQITSAAATGAAKAYQAIVGIPFVGPVLAPIAAGVAFAGIEAFSGMISSARGGWERVPFDGAMTELHKDEMVLPAHIANPMRQMAQNGGQGGGGMTVHLSSTDPRGFKEYLRRNPSALADALKHSHKRGHFAGAMR